jgi:hypothetical protein
MNMEIGTKAAQFPEKEYKNGIFVALKTDKFLRFFKALAGCWVKSIRVNLLTLKSAALMVT